MRGQRDMVLIIGGWLLIGYVVPAVWWVKLILDVLLVWVVINIPIFRWMFSLIGAIKITREQVLLAMKANVWQSAPEVTDEVARRLKVRFPRQVSLLHVQGEMYAMADDGTLEGRPREPPQPALSAPDGCLWEYRRKM